MHVVCLDRPFLPLPGSDAAITGFSLANFVATTSAIAWIVAADSSSPVGKCTSAGTEFFSVPSEAVGFSRWGIALHDSARDR